MINKNDLIYENRAEIEQNIEQIKYKRRSEKQDSKLVWPVDYASLELIYKKTKCKTKQLNYQSVTFSTCISNKQCVHVFHFHKK